MSRRPKHGWTVGILALACAAGLALAGEDTRTRDGRAADAAGAAGDGVRDDVRDDVQGDVQGDVRHDGRDSGRDGAKSTPSGSSRVIGGIRWHDSLTAARAKAASRRGGPRPVLWLRMLGDLAGKT